MSVVALGFGAAGLLEPMRLPFLYPMRHMTALGVGTLAISLMGLIHQRRKLARFSGFAAITVAILTLIGQVIRWTRLELPPQNPLPMYAVVIYTAFPNAICFLVGGVSAALLTARRFSVHQSVLAAIGGAICGTLAFCSALNEVLTLIPANPAFEGEIAIDATISLTLVGFGIVRMAYLRALEGGEEFSLFRPVLVAMLGVVASFVIWRALLQERSNAVAFQSGVTTESVVRAIKLVLKQRLSAVRHAANEPSGLIFEEIGIEAGEYEWTTAEAIATRKEPFYQRLRPVVTQFTNQRHDIYFVHRDRERGLFVVFCAPTIAGTDRVAIVRFSAVLEPAIANIVGPNFEVFFLQNDQELYRYPDPPRSNERTGRGEIRVPEIEGVLRLHPASQFVRRGGTWAAQMALAIGLNASFLIAFSAYLLQVARARLQEVQMIRSGLEREVEERKRAESELARKAKQLEASNADLGEFAHVTSHDLQEPLRSINGFAQLLIRRYTGKFDSDADDFLQYIVEASSRMSGMVQGLLLYSRLVHSKELDEDVPLVDAIEWARSNLLAAFDESHAQLDVGPLPVVRGNRLQFCQLMQNLIGNAIKYRGPDPLKVSVTSDVDGQEHIITVADNGMGVSPEFQERIFGLFKRAHGKEFAGAGVGLALCKKIVERHGGRIWVESTPGKGARFRFTVPSKN